MRPIAKLQRQRRRNPRRSKPQTRPKARRIPRTLTRQENKTPRQPAQIPDTDHKRDPHGPLLRAGQVVHSPRRAPWKYRVDADASQEDHGVAQGHVARNARGEDEEDAVGDDEDALGGDDEGHAPGDAVGEVGAQDCGDGAAGVGRGGEELGAGGGVAHVLDDLGGGGVKTERMDKTP